MKKNVLAIVSGLCLLAGAVQAQSYREMVFASNHNNNVKATSTVVSNATSTDIVDYPTVSFPETANFSADKEKATYHLSWQVNMRENLSYTEVQSSSDGVNFTTVGYVMNDANQKNGNFDYFVPSDKNTNSFRLVQHSLNAQKHTSEIVNVR
ncbi:MAG TPA: hypothetical protein VNB90_09930 [Cytophagaceae bacterium]|nr:hypothetical protein [Cytophagaceae bacterium]